jgi:galactose mutarotase-like enzyme
MKVLSRTWDSFEAIEVEDGSIAVTMLPELGGKLVSLRDLRTGYEWLWRSTRVPLARHPHGTAYIEKADTGGWDECFPTVAPCNYPLQPQHAQHVPDHGDVWAQQWQAEVTTSDDEVRIAGSCRTVTLPCLFSRTLRLRRGTARIELTYEVSNCGSAPVAFIWSAHPLFVLAPGMRLEFPPQARFNVYSATPTTRLAQRTGLQWPFAVCNGSAPVTLDPLPGPDAGIAFKIWSEPLTLGWAALQASQGRLSLHFDVAQIPQIALWLNAGGWSGIGGEPYYNLALEPCIGAQDSLEEAVLKYRQYVRLPPGDSRRWSLEVALQASTRPA